MASCPYEEITAHFDVLKGNADSNVDLDLDNFIGIQRLRWKSLHSAVGGLPNRFEISSVDPLHYSPLTPNIQNGQLFSTCK